MTPINTAGFAVYPDISPQSARGVMSVLYTQQKVVAALCPWEVAPYVHRPMGLPQIERGPSGKGRILCRLGAASSA